MQDDDVVMIEVTKNESHNDNDDIECLCVVKSHPNPDQEENDVEILYEKQPEIYIYDVEDELCEKLVENICYEIDDDDERGNISRKITVEAEVHHEPEASSSKDTYTNESTYEEMNLHDARVRESLDLNLSRSLAPNDIIECSDEDEIINDDLQEVPIIYDVDEYEPVYKTVAVIDLDERKKPKVPQVTEDLDQIFKRTMPSSLPGVAMLFAPDRHLLPDNVRPFRFNYYFFISPHLVTKEISRTEYYSTKEKMFMVKNNIQPCTCLSHPLNQNASRLTLITNPHSLFHRSHCYFSQKHYDTQKRRSCKRKRRFAYQFSLNRMPQKNDSKDFKSWTDVLLKYNNQSNCNVKWSVPTDKENLLEHQPFKLKIETEDKVLMKTENSELLVPTVKREF